MIHTITVEKKFQVKTNQHSLKHLFHQPITTPTQQNWVAKLLDYDFEIFYKPGKTNCAADTLCRKSKNIEFVGVSMLHWLDWEAIEQVVHKDPAFNNVIQAINSNRSSHINFSLVARRLYYKGRSVLPVSSP